MGVGVVVGVGVGVGVGVEAGVGVGVGVGVGDGSRFAVMVPGPIALAVVDMELESWNVMELLLVDHCLNVKPEVGAALIGSDPESIHRLVLVGEIEPLPEGATAKDRRYRVFQLAFSAIGLSIMTEFEAAEPLYESAPAPFHWIKAYSVPAPPETGEVTLKLAVEPLPYQPVPEGEP